LRLSSVVQYQILLEYVDHTLERLKLADKYRKYNPGVPKKGHYKEWLVLSSLLHCSCRAVVVRSSLVNVKDSNSNCVSVESYYISRLLGRTASSQRCSIASETFCLSPSRGTIID